VTIVSGDVSGEAVQWLKAHGARVEGIDLLTITLREQAHVERGAHGWDYSILFYNAEGNDENSWIDIELDVDAYETSLSLKYDGDRECVCKGRGCAECVEELAVIARGDNPYAHHTVATDDVSLIQAAARVLNLEWVAWKKQVFGRNVPDQALTPAQKNRLRRALEQAMLKPPTATA